MTRVRLVALLFVLTASLMVTNIAQAADNELITGHSDFVAHVFCTDPIHVESSWSEMMHTYYDNAGNPIRLEFTGKVTIQYTNLTNGMVYRPNSSGPGMVDLATGEVVLRGSNGALFDQNGVLIATNGRVVLDANGNIISLTGRSVDVCARLGSTPY